MLFLCHDVGATIEKNIEEHPKVFISSIGPSFIQPKGINEITFIAPCNETGDVDLFTKLKVFRKEKWTCAMGILHLKAMNMKDV
jgi:hypothetical protein